MYHDEKPKEYKMSLQEELYCFDDIIFFVFTS